MRMPVCVKLDFDFAFLKIHFLPSGGFAERPGAVKGAFYAAERTLDGEDRSVTIPLGRKVDRRALDYVCPLPLLAQALCEPLLSPPFHPHSWLSDLFARCQLGVLVSAGAAT